jgi:quercetin dioxygenase-like cupin family protein
MTEQGWREKLLRDGFEGLKIVDWVPGWDSGEHSHDQLTAHVILSGQLTVRDKFGTMNYQEGEYVQFPAGTVHSVSGGETAGRMLMGFKAEAA